MSVCATSRHPKTKASGAWIERRGMSIKLNIDGKKYTRFTKSIKPEYIAKTIFFNRAVTESDTFDLHYIFTAGKKEGAEKERKCIVDAISNLKNVLNTKEF